MQKVKRKASAGMKIVLKRGKMEIITAEPEGWQKLYESVEEMRKNGPDAPVDTMGCQMLGSRDQGENIYKYQSLIALMLSSRTKDATTAAAMGRLKAFGLTPENINATSEEKIAQLVHGVGFHNAKAKYIKKSTERLIEVFNSVVPSNMKDLTSLCGIGPKMGFLYLQVAEGKSEGIAVDTHVHRICNRFKWVKSSTPEETRKQLQAWLPETYWDTVNKLLVGFGQLKCTPTRPKCHECSATSLCPYYKDMEDLK